MKYIEKLIINTLNSKLMEAWESWFNPAVC